MREARTEFSPGRQTEHVRHTDCAIRRTRFSPIDPALVPTAQDVPQSVRVERVRDRDRVYFGHIGPPRVQSFCWSSDTTTTTTASE